MLLIRALLFTVLFYGWTTVLGLLVLPVMVVSRRLLNAYGRMWIAGALALLRVTVGITHQVRGADRVPEGPVIFAFKHQSAWDTLVLSLLIHDPAIVLKRELVFIPVFGWCLRRLGHIAVDRQGGAGALKRMIETARARAADGRPIIIFPQGTRTAPGQTRSYHPGVAALYGALDLPVVPVALNSGLFWPRRSLKMRSGTITVEYLPAIAPGLARRHFMGELEGAIETAATRLDDAARQQISRKPS